MTLGRSFTSARSPKSELQSSYRGAPSLTDRSLYSPHIILKQTICPCDQVFRTGVSSHAEAIRESESSCRCAPSQMNLSTVHAHHKSYLNSCSCKFTCWNTHRSRRHSLLNKVGHVHIVPMPRLLLSLCLGRVNAYCQ